MTMLLLIMALAVLVVVRADPPCSADRGYSVEFNRHPKPMAPVNANPMSDTVRGITVTRSSTQEPECKGSAGSSSSIPIRIAGQQQQQPIVQMLQPQVQMLQPQVQIIQPNRQQQPLQPSMMQPQLGMMQLQQQQPGMMQPQQQQQTGMMHHQQQQQQPGIMQPQQQQQPGMIPQQQQPRQMVVAPMQQRELAMAQEQQRLQ